MIMSCVFFPSCFCRCSAFVLWEIRRFGLVVVGESDFLGWIIR